MTTTRYWPKWHPATRSVSGVTERRLALGDEVHEQAVLRGRMHPGTWTVAEHERCEFTVERLQSRDRVLSRSRCPSGMHAAGHAFYRAARLPVGLAR